MQRGVVAVGLLCLVVSVCPYEVLESEQEGVQQLAPAENQLEESLVASSGDPEDVSERDILLYAYLMRARRLCAEDNLSGETANLLRTVIDATHTIEGMVWSGSSQDGIMGPDILCYFKSLLSLANAVESSEQWSQIYSEITRFLESTVLIDDISVLAGIGSILMFQNNFPGQAYWTLEINKRIVASDRGFVEWNTHEVDGKTIHTPVCGQIGSEETFDQESRIDVTFLVKIRHDKEQYAYLMDKGILDRSPEIVSVYEQLESYYNETILARGFMNDEPLQVPWNIQAILKCNINPSTAERLPGPVVNRNIDWAYLNKHYNSIRWKILTIDEFLIPEAISELRRFAMESTSWHGVKPNYIGSYFNHGFATPLLLQIVEELRELLPDVIGDLPIGNAWAYKYQHEDAEIQDAKYPDVPGIGIHADPHIVNFNFWVTPESAIDYERSKGDAHAGLTIWHWAAPPEWKFSEYQPVAEVHHSNMMTQIMNENEGKTSVKYGYNRGVLFDSSLMHETGKFYFKPGYENRRINYTILMGTRKS